MPSITKRLADAITEALQGRQQAVFLTETWREIHKNYAVGIRQEKRLLLSIEDREFLRQLIIKAAGYDPLSDVPCLDNRLQAAATIIDEKWAGSAGTGQYVYLYRSGAPIVTTHGPATVPPGSGLWVNSLDVIMTSTLPLVVVENLTAFLNIDAFLLPAEWKGALFIYRGHNESTAGTGKLLERTPAEARIAVMSDYDPAGLRIALSTARATGWLGPTLDTKLGTSNSELYEKQAAYLKGLQDDSSEGLRPVVIRLIQEKIAFTQERMAAAHTPLAYYPFQ